MSVVPHYDLDNVREAAKQGQLTYGGRAALRDISNLGFEFNDVVSCILSLTPSDFYKGYDYEGVLYDAYRINYSNPNSDSNETDPLYIKF